MDSTDGKRTENSAYPEKTDEDLIDLCRADREAFAELARRYRPLAFRAAFCVLRNATDAEDQVQNALCKAFEHMGDFRRSAKFSTWLVRIVVNECLMHLRRTQRVARISIDGFEQEDTVFEIRDNGRSPETAVAELFLGRLLRREIRRIPPLLRNAFVLRDIQQKPMPEVARNLGISVQAAKSRLARAREELRQRLKPHISSAVVQPPAQSD